MFPLPQPPCNHMINPMNQTPLNDPKNIYFYKKTELVQEPNESQRSLWFLYKNPLGKFFRRHCMRHRWFANLVARHYNSPRSIKLIKPFIDKYHIVMDDFEVPKKGFSSFNDFFIRKLKPGKRVIDPSPNNLAAPADSKIYAIPTLTPDSIFYVKQQPFNLERFVGNATMAEYFDKGTLLMFRLAPYDYHHFHFPIECTPSPASNITGSLESVNPIAFKSGVQPLIENERHVILLQTSAQNLIAMILVGAMIVGKIVETYTPHALCKKGDTAGYFAFGGSTIVLLCKQGMLKTNPLFLQHSLQGFETEVKMGEVIGTLEQK